jgi:protein-tyrosine kinase
MMKQDTPVRAPASVIERATDVYDFGGLLRTSPVQAAPPAAAPILPAQAYVPVAPARPDPVSVPVPLAPVFQDHIGAAAPSSIPAAAPMQQEHRYAAPQASQRVAAQIDLDSLRIDGFIEPGAAPTMLSEEFRLAKRQILLSAFGGRNVRAIERGRAILVCSASPNEGKTFCSINLALSLSSERDLEVLLIDVDVAKPEILSTLGIEGGPGLMDAIADSSLDPESLVIRTSLPSLSILPTGRRTNDDTELLASKRTQEVMERLLSHSPNRVIIIDTAPALAASPGSVLAHHVGQIVMVVRADKTGENELREAIGLLDGCEHIQLLLNGATYSGANQKFGSYYGYGG